MATTYNSKKKTRLWGNLHEKETSEHVLFFLGGRDCLPFPALDSFLKEEEIAGSIAHARMLGETGIIPKEEAEEIISTLLEKQFAEELRITPEVEDVHTALELLLTEKIGEPGKKLHTARSRNDQIALDTRLYIKKQIGEYTLLLKRLINSILEKADAEKGTPMPGYTHHRRAMITSFGHYLLSVAVALERDLKSLYYWNELYDESPLGGAAAYGTAFPIDREMTAGELGFRRPTESSLDPIQTRWEPEAHFIYSLASIMNHLSSLSQTLIIFASPEFGYLALPDEYSTGSSIMPQKKNPDFLELVKGKSSLVNGFLATLLSEGHSQFIGYNKNGQVAKQALMEAVFETKGALALYPDLIEKITPDRKRMKDESGKHFITATHFLEQYVSKTGTDFRTAKGTIELAVKYSEKEGAEKITYSAFKKAGGTRLSKSEVRAFQDPAKILFSYKSYGSPNPRILSSQIRAMRARIGGK